MMKSQLTKTLYQNKLEIGVCLLITLSASLIWVWAFNTHYFNRRDAFDYAQLSRQIYQGDGLSTLQIFPRHIPYFRERSLLGHTAWPNLYRNPLITITGAAFQQFFESVVVAMVIQSGFWYLASAPLLFFLAKEITHLQVAVLSAIFYLADPVVLLYSYSGMTESLGTFLLLSFFVLAYLGTPRGWKWLLLGAVSLLAYLARTQLIVLIPLAFAFAWFKAPRNRRSMSFLLILAGLSLPLITWALRNLQVAGDPLFSFTTTRNLVLDAIPGHSDLEMQLHAPVDLFTILSRYGSGIASKLVHNTTTNVFSPLYWANSFRRMMVFLPLFAFVGFLRSFKSSRNRYDSFIWSTAALILATFLLVSLTVYSVRSYVMFRPLIPIIAFNELFGLLEGFTKSRLVRTGFIAALILLGGYTLTSEALAHKNSPPPLSQFDQRAYESLIRKTSENSLIASDISEQISLYTGRRTVRLPADPTELLEINQDYLLVDYVLLSRELLSGSYAEEDEPGYHEIYQDYSEFVSSKAFLDLYQPGERLPNGSQLYRRIRALSP